MLRFTFQKFEQLQKTNTLWKLLKEKKVFITDFSMEKECKEIILKLTQESLIDDSNNKS